MTTTEPTASGDWEGIDDVSWTLLDRDELVDAYWAVVAPALRTEGLDPERDRPTHEWLREHGCRSLLYALREHHDRTFAEFWREDLGLERDEGYDYATDDEQTVEALESFLASRRDRKGLAESSIDTLRYRLNRYVEAYCVANDTDDLITPVVRGSDTPVRRATEACWAAFDRLHAELGGGQTKRRIHLAVSNWYDHLVRRNWADLNPAAGLAEEFDWSDASGGDETPCLDAGHVRALHREAGDATERLLVVALAGWGLRPNEVASLHVSQFASDADVPYLRFGERKNGPGEVSVLFGRDAFEERRAELETRDDWNGYLFPSPHASSDHVSRSTIWNWFTDLAARADLPDEIAGVSVSPKLCRRFWYDAYTSVLDAVLAGVEEIAAEQGSADPRVVMQNYLSDDRARQVRRKFMRAELADAFESR